MSNKPTKTRSKNFTAAELSVLVEEVEKYRGVLFGPLKGPNLTQHHRDRAWLQVADAVNAVAPAHRSTNELKKKFKDLKTRTKQKANSVKREGRKTGGGENEANTPLNAIENKVVQFIGKESIEGIVGGVDTFRKSIENRPSTSTASVGPAAAANELTDTSRTPSPTLSTPRTSRVFKYIKSNPAPPPAPAPAPTPAPGHGPGPTSTLPPMPKRGTKRTRKALALEELRRTTNLQEESNQLLRQLIAEFRSFKEEFLNIKKLELELLNQSIEIKKKKIE